MGFFSKIFGGGKKTDSQEQKAVSGEQKAIVDTKSQVSKTTPATPLPEEERVPEPELQTEDHTAPATENAHKATVFGMPAPPFAMDSRPVASGEAIVQESVIDVPAERSVRVSAGELVVGEVAMTPSDAVESGSIVTGETVLEPASDTSLPAAEEEAVFEPAPDTSLPPAEEETAKPVSEGTEAEEEIEIAETEAVVPPPLPAAEPEVRVTSGSKDALLDEEPLNGDLELVPKNEKRDLRSSIECISCKHRLPVPYVGYPARITCPFCLTVNDYNL